MKTFDNIQTELAAGTTTCESITNEYLNTIEEKKHLNAFLSVFKGRALTQANLVDKKLREGKAGPLAGMVISIKDIINVKDERTTCGSKILENFTSLYDATVIKRLQAADAIIIGKTNMDEFAMGSSTENSAYGRVKLPQDVTRVREVQVVVLQSPFRQECLQHRSDRILEVPFVNQLLFVGWLDLNLRMVAYRVMVL